ncbi:ion transporter [Pseudoruegeria sp. SK021]|uniref:ion transporter n=1 Tax=Pseudoruegeria sp. SK021 TaxID=1933035 RepID=UPI000A235FB1|nr:ion transporter [Pseudoruegeria sp. SK021]OSP56045.1 hypothetical protein BV911_03660 [Pseudoruegeria sp. SK021]
MMTRAEILHMLDGTHPTRTMAVSYALQAVIMLSALAISLQTMPNLPHSIHEALSILEIFALIVFTVEYITRLICAPKPLGYAFSFWGIIDLLSCAPILLFLNPNVAAIRALRLMRLLRLLKLLHTNRALHRLERALEASKGELAIFGVLALIILYIAAVGIYIFEHDAQPEQFSSIPVSIWWAVVSFTTVGYGDIYPITMAGRAFTSIVLFIGLGVIAVPTAIITTALINTDLHDKIVEDVGQDVRQDLKKDLKKMTNKPKRRF